MSMLADIARMPCPPCAQHPIELQMDVLNRQSMLELGGDEATSMPWCPDFEFLVASAIRSHRLCRCPRLITAAGA